MTDQVTEPKGSIILRSETLPVGQLQHYRRNPRRHHDANLQESLSTLGQYRRIVVNIGTETGRAYEVLAGNGTLENAVKIGHTDIDVDLVDVDDVTASKIMLEDNRGNDLAFLLGYDTDLLLEELGELPDLEASGWTQDDIDKMLTPPEPEEEPDPASQMGDLEFRVVVDCRDEDDQAHLLASLEAEGRIARPLIS